MTIEKKDSTVNANEAVYAIRLAAWEKSRFSPPPEPDSVPKKPSLIEMLAMRDGHAFIQRYLCHHGTTVQSVKFSKAGQPY